MLAWGLLGALAGILFSKVEMIGILDNRSEYIKKEAKNRHTNLYDTTSLHPCF